MEPLTSAVFVSIVGKPVAKFLFKQAFPELAADMSGELLDTVIKRFFPDKEAKAVEQRFAKMGESVALDLWPLFEHEAPEVNPEAVAHAISDTITGFLTAQVVVDARFKAEALEAFLKTADASRVSQLGDGKWLYYRALHNVAPQLVELAPEMKQFQIAVFGRLLEQGDDSKKILAEIKDLIDRLPQINTIDTWLEAARQSELRRFAQYEANYLVATRQKQDYMELFGVGGSNYDIQPLMTVAYVTLNLRDGEGNESRKGEAERVFDRMNPNNAKLLIAGEAGGGKSTLMRWIAVQATSSLMGVEKRQHSFWHDAEADLGEAKATVPPWRQKVPFLIRLRSLAKRGYTLPPDDEIPLLEVTETPPAGWVTGVIKAGRALFLFDGFDEVPEPRKPELRQSIARLMNDEQAAKGNLFVLTSRPGGVRDDLSQDWIGRNALQKSEVLPLTPNEAQSLIARWHEAARRNLPEEARRNHSCQLRARLLGEKIQPEGIEYRLWKTVNANPALGQLMDNPLLVSMVCALNLWSNEQPPKKMVALCESLCKLLVEDKHLLSGLESAEIPSYYTELDYQDKRFLLQAIAVSMVAPDWKSEIEWSAAHECIRQGLDELKNPNPDNAEKVLQQLLVRAGLLREHSGIVDDELTGEHLTSALEFIHNTFKEHLAADWMVENDTETLFQHLSADNWDNILLFAAGHIRNRTIAKELIGRLLDSAEPRAWKFALQCEMVANFNLGDDLTKRLSGLKARLEEQIQRPTNEEEAKTIALLGDEAAKGLVWREGLSEPEAKACVMALGFIKTETARTAAETYIHDERVFDELVRVINPLLIPKVLELLQTTKWRPGELEWRQQITDLTTLSNHPQITCLNLSETNVSDVTPLEKLTNLQNLYLSGTNVSDVTPLEKLTNLRELNLIRTAVSDVTPLEKLTNLRELNLISTAVSDVTPLEKLTNLQSLFLSGTAVSDVTPLEKLTNLQYLDLHGTAVSDLTPLEKLTNLQSLVLNGTNVSDVTPLEKLTNLRELNLISTAVSDVTPLEKLTNLQSLFLNGTAVSDVTPLEKLTNLQSLVLIGSAVSDVTPLGKLTNLQLLYLSREMKGKVRGVELLGKKVHWV